MNIFPDNEAILGKTDTKQLAQALSDFFSLAGEIRGKLGVKAYLLDKYLSYLLGAANETLCYDAADNGFMGVSELNKVCHEALYGGDEQKEHPLYEKAVAYLDAHPIPYQEEMTRKNILAIAMFNEHLELVTRGYFKEQSYKLMRILDNVHIEQLYREISQLIGGELLMERLNLAIRQRFFLVPVMAAFTQGLTNQLISSLNHRDMETCRQVFQLVLDAGDDWAQIALQ